MSIRTFLRIENDWLLADQADRLKTAAMLLFLGGTTMVGLVLLVIGLLDR